MFKKKIKCLIEQHKAEELYFFSAISKNLGLVACVLQGFEYIYAAGLHRWAHDIFVSAFHSIQLEDCLILLQHLFDGTGLTESAWQGSHAKSLVVSSKKGRPLKLIYDFVHFGKGIPEGMVNVFGQHFLVRLGLKPG